LQAACGDQSNYSETVRCRPWGEAYYPLFELFWVYRHSFCIGRNNLGAGWEAWLYSIAATHLTVFGLINIETYGVGERVIINQTGLAFIGRLDRDEALRTELIAGPASGTLTTT
jgi:hypothetical protein